MNRGVTNAGFWIGLVLGVPVVGYGVVGAVGALPGVQLTSFLQYFVGAALVHDLVLAPLVGVVGWVVLRSTPPIAAAPVQAALISSGIVGLVAWPFVRKYGMTAGEPSFLSRNYAASVLGCWAVIWAIAAAVVVGRVIGRRR